MALPKAAQQQLEDAEKLHAEVYESFKTEVSDAEPEQPDEPSATPESAAPDADGQDDSGEGEGLQEVRGAEGEDAPDADAGKWKHKYDVLKGKYDAEVPRLQRQLQAQSSQVGEMQAQIDQLLQAQIDAKEAAPTPTESLLSAEEIEDYGEDMIAVVKKAAREEFQQEAAALRKENEQLRQVLGGMQQQNAMNTRERMMDDLDTSVPNWREINSNQEFLGWLENVDPYSGHKKLDLLRSAFENNNTARVTAFFKGWLNENAAFTSKQEPSSEQPQVSLDTLVAPGRPSDGNVDRAQEGNVTGRTWSQGEIAEFYRDVQRGVYRNNPDERDRLERDIFLAQEQGRIVT